MTETEKASAEERAALWGLPTGSPPSSGEAAEGAGVAAVLSWLARNFEVPLTEWQERVMYETEKRSDHSTPHRYRAPSPLPSRGQMHLHWYPYSLEPGAREAARRKSWQRAWRKASQVAWSRRRTLRAAALSVERDR